MVQEKTFLTFEELQEQLHTDLENYAFDFDNDFENHLGCSYVSDIFSEFADSNTSIYYSDIMDYIRNNPDEVTDAINEFGWDGVGRDIYKAGQMAEYESILNELYHCEEEIRQNHLIRFILRKELQVTAEQLEQMMDDCLDCQRFYDIENLVYDNIEEEGE